MFIDIYHNILRHTILANIHLKMTIFNELIWKFYGDHYFGCLCIYNVHGVLRRNYGQLSRNQPNVLDSCNGNVYYMDLFRTTIDQNIMEWTHNSVCKNIYIDQFAL